MKSLVVISTPEQLALFRSIPLCENDVTIFCDSDDMAPLLTQQGIAFRRLDEFLIRDQWNTINSWACGRTAGWIQLCRHSTPAGMPDVLPALCLPFSLLLTAAVKNYKYAEYLIETFQPTMILMFESGDPRLAFPAFSGNDTLNYFLDFFAKKKNISTKLLEITPAGRSNSEIFFAIKKAIRDFLKKLIAVFLLRAHGSITKKSLLVYGSLRHLGSLVDFLQKKKTPLVIFDDEFHGELFRYAKNRKIPYLTAHQFKTPSWERVKRQAKLVCDQLMKKFEEAQGQRYFEFEGYDFGKIFRDNIFGTMTRYFEAVAQEWLLCADLAQKVPLAGCLVEEDFAGRGNFCAFMDHFGIQNFCISHAHGVFDFDVGDAYRAFSQSLTFVNSEHEKLKMYAFRGWDLSKIIVSGTPRYDGFSKKPPHDPSATSRAKILFCAGWLAPFTPDTASNLGLHMFGYRYYQQRSLDALIEAADGLLVEIVIKSHYVEDDQAWKDYIRGKGTHIKTLKHSTDFMTELMKSQAMVVSYWSTSIIEAALCEVPTIYVDLHSEKSPSVLEFASHGLCRYVNSVATLRRELRDIVERRDGRGISQTGNSQREYFLGKKGRNNTESAGNIILRHLETSL